MCFFSRTVLQFSRPKQLARQIFGDLECGQYDELVRIVALVCLLPEPGQLAIVADLLTVTLRELSAEKAKHVA